MLKKISIPFFGTKFIREKIFNTLNISTRKEKVTTNPSRFNRNISFIHSFYFFFLCYRFLSKPNQNRYKSTFNLILTHSTTVTKCSNVSTETPPSPNKNNCHRPMSRKLFPNLPKADQPCPLISYGNFCLNINANQTAPKMIQTGSLKMHCYRGKGIMNVMVLVTAVRDSRLMSFFIVCSLMNLMVL